MRLSFPPVVLPLLLAGIAPQVANAAADGTSVLSVEEMASTEQGLTRPGEALYEALAGKRPRHLVADPLRFKFEAPYGSPSIALASGFRDEIERAALSKTTIPEDGNAPTTPGYPGAVEVNQRCGVINTGRGPEFAQIEYRYEWRPIADTNRDGQRDKHDEHGWVLTAENWRAWPADTIEAC